MSQSSKGVFGLALAVACGVAACSSHSQPKGLPGAGGKTDHPGAGPLASDSPSVLQLHRSPTRDGLYIDAALTHESAPTLHRDTSFNAALEGPTYAQPLYWSPPEGGRDLVIAATEQNQVYAFNAADGSVVWSRSLGTPAPVSEIAPCGNIDPLGVTGTPVIDPASRTLVLDAMVSVNGKPNHFIFGLSVDDGTVRPGWPVDVSKMRAGNTTFNSVRQNQRGGLIVLGNTAYVPYGGHWGDCAVYHGWVVGVPLDNPGGAFAWATRAEAGGTWAPGGIASDGTSLFIATGNTMGATSWGDGEAILRLGSDLKFSAQAPDYFAPNDWLELDAADVDIGGSGPVLFHVPGAEPSDLIVALGKNRKAYLLDRTNLGGISDGLASQTVAGSTIINSAAAYTTSRGTYVVFKGRCPQGNGNLTAIKISATAPPTIAFAWCANQQGSGSPIVTTTDGQSQPIVWSVGAESANRLFGFDGDTGATIFAGGGGGEQMTSVSRFQTPIAVKGRLFVAGDDQVYAFTVQ